MQERFSRQNELGKGKRILPFSDYRKIPFFSELFVIMMEMKKKNKTEAI